MPTQTATPADSPVRAKSAADLKKRAVHENVTLPSGILVDIKLPNLPQMIKSKGIPNDLVDSALAQQDAEKLTREILEETWDWAEFIIPLILVSPKVETDDVKELDPADIQLLLDLGARRTDMDAVGHQLGGLETQKAFREHRGILSLDEAMGNVS